MEDGVRTIGFFQLIRYPVAFGKSYLYIPHGPVFIAPVSEELLKDFKKDAEDILEREKAIFLRFDSYFIEGSTFDKYGIFYKTPKFMYDGGFQPKYEWVLDLSASEGEILSGMKKVNRYTIKQAEKLGVSIEIVEKDFRRYFDKFYELVEMTAERDAFSHQPREYYETIFDSCEKASLPAQAGPPAEAGRGFLSVARFKGRIMLINFYVTYGSSAYFLFSGSENENRKIGYTYLAQWEAIKYVKGLGFKYYNFGAVIPENNEYRFYKKWLGFSNFKKRFGGTIVEHGDFYDLVRDKFWYVLYLARKFMNLFKKRILD